MSFPFFFSRFHINNLLFFLICFPSVSSVSFFLFFFFFFLMLLFSSSHFSFSAFPFLLPLFFFAHISPLPDIRSFICSLLLTAKIPNSISATATWVLFLAATGGSSAFFAALDSSQGKQKIRLWKSHSSNWSYPRGCVWIVCYKVNVGQWYKQFKPPLLARPWLPPRQDSDMGDSSDLQYSSSSRIIFSLLQTVQGDRRDRMNAALGLEGSSQLWFWISLGLSHKAVRSSQTLH